MVALCGQPRDYASLHCAKCDLMTETELSFIRVTLEWSGLDIGPRTSQNQVAFVSFLTDSAW
jgi:hypothetical protein